MLQLAAVKTIPKAAPRGEKVGVSFLFFSIRRLKIYVLVTRFLAFIQKLVKEFAVYQGNILWFMTFFIFVTHLLITRSFSPLVRYASWLKLWSVA